jgi:hypothetical protein
MVNYASFDALLKSLDDEYSKLAGTSVPPKPGDATSASPVARFVAGGNANNIAPAPHPQSTAVFSGANVDAGIPPSAANIADVARTVDITHLGGAVGVAGTTGTTGHVNFSDVPPAGSAVFGGGANIAPDVAPTSTTIPVVTSVTSALATKFKGNPPDGANATARERDAQQRSTPQSTSTNVNIVSSATQSAGNGQQQIAQQQPDLQQIGQPAGNNPNETQVQPAQQSNKLSNLVTSPELVGNTAESGKPSKLAKGLKKPRRVKATTNQQQAQQQTQAINELTTEKPEKPALTFEEQVLKQIQVIKLTNFVLLSIVCVLLILVIAVVGGTYLGDGRDGQSSGTGDNTTVSAGEKSGSNSSTPKESSLEISKSLPLYTINGNGYVITLKNKSTVGSLSFKTDYTGSPSGKFEVRSTSPSKPRGGTLLATGQFQEEVNVNLESTETQNLVILFVELPTNSGDTVKKESGINLSEVKVK